MTTIAFIGVGHMGGPMARNLVKVGLALRVFDVSADAAKGITGANAAATIAEAVKDADTIITMLPAGQHVRAVYLNEGGVLASAKKGALLIDCSTIDMESARAAHAAAKKAGFDFLD